MLPCSASQRSPPYTLSPLATRHWKKSLPFRAAAGPPRLVAEPTTAARPVTNCWRLSNSLNVPDSKLPLQVTLPDGGGGVGAESVTAVVWLLVATAEP